MTKDINKNIKSQHSYLQFILTILKVITLWPSDGQVDLKWREMRSYFVFVSTMPTWIPLFVEIFFNPYTENDAVNQIKGIVSMACVLGMFYISVCFIQNRSTIKKLVERISTFEIYTGTETIEIDKKITFYSKLFVVYSLGGLFTFFTEPWIEKKHCEEHTPKFVEKYHLSCLMITYYRLPFKTNVFPYEELCVLHQFYISGLTVIVVVALTLLICGIVVHMIYQLRHLRELLVNVCKDDEEELRQAVRYAIEYHIFIIEYCDSVNEAFGPIIVLHITLTSFVIGVLCFGILLADNIIASVAFVLHLAGWVVILFLICFSGQNLIDESTGVAVDLYAASWHTCPVYIQKDIYIVIMRSQTSLKLKALNIASMSVETFLAVLRTAYSYFTLLINMI